MAVNGRDLTDNIRPAAAEEEKETPLPDNQCVASVQSSDAVISIQLEKDEAGNAVLSDAALAQWVERISQKSARLKSLILSTIQNPTDINTNEEAAQRAIIQKLLDETIEKLNSAIQVSNSSKKEQEIHNTNLSILKTFVASQIDAAEKSANVLINDMLEKKENERKLAEEIEKKKIAFTMGRKMIKKFFYQPGASLHPSGETDAMLEDLWHHGVVVPPLLSSILSEKHRQRINPPILRADENSAMSSAMTHAHVASKTNELPTLRNDIVPRKKSRISKKWLILLGLVGIAMGVSFAVTTFGFGALVIGFGIAGYILSGSGAASTLIGLISYCMSSTDKGDYDTSSVTKSTDASVKRALGENESSGARRTSAYSTHSYKPLYSMGPNEYPNFDVHDKVRHNLRGS